MDDEPCSSKQKEDIIREHREKICKLEIKLDEHLTAAAKLREELNAARRYGKDILGMSLGRDFGW